MKKYLLLFVLLFVTFFAAHAQFALLQMNVGDCPKCVYGFQVALEKSASKLPVFTIFPYYAPKDQLKIKSKMGAFAKTCPPIFDDALYKQTAKVGQQGIYYFSKEGEIVYQKPLLEISEQTVLTLDSIYANDYLFMTKMGKFYYAVNDEILEQDFQLSRIKKYTSNQFVDYFELSPVIVERIIHKIAQNDADFFEINKLYASLHNLSEEDVLALSLVKAYGINGITYLTIKLKKYIFTGSDPENIEQSLTNEDNELGIMTLSFMVKYQNNTIVDMYKIPPYTNEINPEFTLTEVFMPVNDSVFLGLVGNPYYDPDKQYFFSEFLLKDGTFSFLRQLPIPYPQDYISKHLNYPDLAYFAIAYPYFYPSNSQYLVDFSNNKYQDIANAFGGKPTTDGNNSIKNYLDNRILVKNTEKEQLYLLSKLDNKHYCFLIDLKTNTVTHHFDFPSSKIPIHSKEYPVILVDNNRKRFFLEDPESKVRAYPLVFLEQMQ